MASVGGLLPRDLIDRVVAGDTTVPGTDATDYGLVPGERLSDAITRSWNRLQGVWDGFRKALAQLSESDQTATALTRERWLRPLLDELGFAGLPVARGLAIDGKDYPISHQWGDTVPVHLPGARVPIDRATKGVRGAAHASPHGLVQEYLNRSDTALWGVVSNGLLLRILRDNASMTRQAFVEFDLEAMFDSESFSDFVVLWLCCHRTRFEGAPAEKCFLEQWTAEAASAGTRALDKLRSGVEAAIASLGEGFVQHPDNGELRQALRSGALTADDLQRQVLRLVYRLLFLLVAESRDLLLDPHASEPARERYRRFYSLERIKTLAIKRRGTAHDDLWASLRVTMEALGSTGAPSIGLAPLGSFLWSPSAIADLRGATIDNRRLLEAVRSLCFVRDAEAKAQRAVDYRNLGAEELGSVYESLLELHAEVNADARTFSLATAAGNERKTTGSYYTPTSLIRVLLDSALDPVLDDAERAADPEAALLALKVMDPAAGSGHFLIASAHRIARRLASVRAGGGEPAPDDLRHALREVIGRCIYGIDVNPMAVELCKVSLWMEATEPGRPLSFLDHRIVCGNSLLGTTPALLEAGVPDEAFKVLEGDDKAWVTTLRKSNKEQRKRRDQGTLDFGAAVGADVAMLAAELSELDALDDQSISGIAAKEHRFAALQASAEAKRAKLVADAWCAAFVVPKVKSHPIITDDVVRRCGGVPDRLPADVRDAISDEAENWKFLHLHVAFPDVFHVPDDLSQATNRLCGWNGGFDVVLGNPPWDKVEFSEQEFFATRDPDLALLTGARRKNAIARLASDDPALFAAYSHALRHTEGERHVVASGGRFPLCGRGKINTFGLFAELMRSSISTTGRVGVIVPTGIATEDTSKFFFADLVEGAALVSLFDFENRLQIFSGVHRSQKFALLTMSGDARPIEDAEFVFFALETADLDDPDKRFTLAPADFSLLNPNTKTCPVFRTRRDAEITKAIYLRTPSLSSEASGWRSKLERQVNMSHWADALRERAELEQAGLSLQGSLFLGSARAFVPVIEAKATDYFDHRAADVVVSETALVRQSQSQGLSASDHEDPCRTSTPRYWVGEDTLEGMAGHHGWTWVLGFREITASTNERTMVPTVLPGVAIGYKTWLVYPGDESLLLPLAANFGAILFDYVVRQKVGGITLAAYIAEQLPVIPASRYESDTPWSKGTRLRDWLEPRVLELVYTSWDMIGGAARRGISAPPFRWSDERRMLLQVEIDAAFFHLYCIERDDVDYILDTFPILKRNDEAVVGEYRTKRLILERFDAMAEAESAGCEYETILDPPPAHPSLAHDVSTRPPWADWYLKGGE